MNLMRFYFEKLTGRITTELADVCRFRFGLFVLECRYRSRVGRLECIHFFRMLPLKVKLIALYFEDLFLYWKKQISNFAVGNARIQLRDERDEFSNQAHNGGSSVFPNDQVKRTGQAAG